MFQVWLSFFDKVGNMVACVMFDTSKQKGLSARDRRASFMDKENVMFAFPWANLKSDLHRDNIIMSVA